MKGSLSLRERVRVRGSDEVIVAVENAFCGTGSRSRRAPVPSLS